MPSGAVTLPTTARTPVRMAGGDTWVNLHLMTALSAAFALVAATAGWPLAWGLLTLLAVAWALARQWTVAVCALPAASLVVVTVAIVVVLVAGLFGLQVLGGALAARVVLAVVTCAGVGVAMLLRSEGPVVATPRSTSSLVIAGAPAAFMAVLLVVIRLSGEGRLAWFLSADHLRHLGLTTRTIDAGTLDYASQPFPRGWHAVVGTMWAATGAERNGEGLRRLVDVQSSATWLLLVLLPLGLAVVAVGAATGLGLGPRSSGLAGLVAGALVLGPRFFGDYVPRGFDTTILVVLVIVAAVLVVMAGPTTRAALAAGAAACLVTAHTWQVLLVPAVSLAVAVLAWRRPWSLQPRAGAVDALVVTGLAAASLPGVVGVARGLGLEHAAAAGDVPPPILVWSLVVGAACAALVSRSPRAGLPVVIPAGAAAATAMGLAVVSGVGIGSYYPSKTLWVATVLGLPALAGVVALALSALDGPTPARRFATVVGGSVVGLGVALSVASPAFGVLRSSWGAADSDFVMRLATSPPAESATVVWQVGTPVDDATTQLLIDFYSASAGTPRLGLAPTRVADQCALLAATKAPRVLSTAPEAEVLARFTCSDDLEVVRPLQEAPVT